MGARARAEVGMVVVVVEDKEQNRSCDYQHRHAFKSPVHVCEPLTVAVAAVTVAVAHTYLIMYTRYTFSTLWG